MALRKNHKKPGGDAGDGEGARRIEGAADRREVGGGRLVNRWKRPSGWWLLASFIAVVIIGTIIEQDAGRQ